MRSNLFKIAQAAGIASALVLTISCSSDDENEGKTYKTVKIGSQIWMAENLNYNVSGSKCYGEGGQVYDPETGNYITLSNSEIQANCAKYGRLYDWETAKTVCPAGWHLPSDAEWITLGGTKTAGTKLKSTSGWNYDGNGTDDYGFSALPGGYGNSDGSFSSVGEYGHWWSATEFSTSSAWSRTMGYDYAGVAREYIDNSDLFSVRCVQD